MADVTARSSVFCASGHVQIHATKAARAIGAKKQGLTVRRNGCRSRRPRTRAHGHRRCAHRARRARRVGRPRRSEPAEPPHARRVRAAPARRASSSSRWPSSCPPAPGASWPGSSGPLLGLLLLVKILDIGFFTAFDRPFNPVDDWSYAGIGIETLRDSIGRTSANLVVAGARAARRRRARRSRPWRCCA